MSDNFSSPSVLLKHGVVWLKSRQKKLIKNMVTQMGTETDSAQRRLPALLRRFVATDMINDLIRRLETNVFEAEEVRRKMLRGLKRGATVQSLVNTTDLLLKVINDEAQIGLAQQPEVKKILLSKTEYFVNLVKGAVAGAHIDFERSKISSSKNSDD